MLFRSLGALMVLAGCSGIGMAMSSAYARRVKEITAFILAMERLEAEVCGALRPLADALDAAAEHAPRGVAATLRSAAASIRDGIPASEAWNSALRACASQTCLDRDDIDALSGLAVGLGASSADDQRRLIRYVSMRLKTQETAARISLAKEGRIWGYAGVLGGLALAAVLI